MEDFNCKHREENKGIDRFFSKDKNTRFMNILALILVLYSMWYFGTLLFIVVPEDNVRFVDTIIGFLLGSVIGVVINYYYGAAASHTEWNGEERRRSNLRSTDIATTSSVDKNDC